MTADVQAQNSEEAIAVVGLSLAKDKLGACPL